MLQETIKQRQIRGVHDDLGGPRGPLRGRHGLQDFVHANRRSGGQAGSQRVVDEVQSVVLRSMQEFQIVLDRRGLGGPAPQLIERHAEPSGRVHMLDILVVEKRTWLPHQRVDDVAEIDGLLVFAVLPRHPVQTHSVVPQFQVILMHVHFDAQANVLAVHRVRIPFHANHAIGLDLHVERGACGVTCVRQRFENGSLLAKAGLTRRITTRDEVPHERHVGFPGIEVTTPSQPQGLVQRILEVTVRRFDISVLVRSATVNSMPLDSVVRQQVAVPARELLMVGQILDCCRQAVAADATRHATHEVQRVL